jgi:hypothetical protein
MAAGGPQPPDVLPSWVVACTKLRDGVPAGVAVHHPALDLRLPRLMEQKAEQMGSNNANVLVIGISQIPGKMEYLAPQIMRRFQPNLNRRFGAVVLMKSALHSDQMTSRTQVHVMRNPHATTPVPEQLLEQLARLDMLAL